MKIAFVSPAIRLGGVDMFCLTLGESLVHCGHDITYIETAFIGDWSHWFQERGHNVLSYPLHPWKSAYKHAKSFIEILKIYDIVIFNDDSFARAIAGLLPISTTVIAIVHTDIKGQYITALGYNGDYDNIVVVSQAIKDKIKNEYNISPKNIIYIPYGVEVTEIYPLRSKEESCLRVIFLGRLSDWHKGIFKIPKIMSLIRKSYKVSLSIVGEGPDRYTLDNLFNDYEFRNNVFFLGSLHKEDVRNILLQHDVLLMPSNFEGLPIALLEAMASGVVPIVSRLKGSTDLVVDNNVNGFILEKDDIEEFANCINILAENKDLLDRMSRQAWVRIRKEFSFDRMSQSYLKVINDSRVSNLENSRSGVVDRKLLGDFPNLPNIMIRPTRKIIKIAGLWNKD